MGFKKEMRKWLGNIATAVSQNKREQDNFERQVLAFMERADQRFAQLDSNGVATAINKLNAEVFKDKKEDESISSVFTQFWSNTRTKDEVPTLAGKVDAIIQHLGIDVSVKPKQVTAAKVEAKKKPAKKGKK